MISGKDRINGFSLIELLVVIGIITLFTVIAVPKYSNINNHAKLAKTKTNLVNIKNAFANYYYDRFLEQESLIFPPTPGDSLLTQDWADATTLENGAPVSTLFSEGIILYNPESNPYRYALLPETEFENGGFILRDPDYNITVRFRP